MVLDGTAHSLAHPNQAAELFGLTVGEAQDAFGHVRDLDAILIAWVACVEHLPWAVLVEPTPSRQRTIRDLAVNVFVPIPLLRASLRDKRMMWPGDPNRGVPGVPALEEHEASFVSELRDRDALADFVRATRLDYADFVPLAESAVKTDPTIETPRGALPFSILLETIYGHSAHHLRQVIAFLEESRYDVPTAYRVEQRDLPERIY